MERTAAKLHPVAISTALLAISLAVFFGPVQPAAESAEPPSESSAASEQRVFYADMLDAYEAGQLAEARQLARQHLRRLGERMLNPPHALEKASICHGTLGLLKFMFIYESQFAAGQRFGDQSDLLQEIDKVFAKAAGLRAELTSVRPAMQAYLDNETAIVAAEWIRVREGLVASAVLSGTYDVFQDDLERAGFASLDAVLSGKQPSTAPQSPFLAVSSNEASAIEQTINDYFQGLIDGDARVIMGATELDEPATIALLDSMVAEYQQEGILTIQAIRLPPLSDARLRLQSNEAGDEFIATTLRGVELDVTLLDGTSTTIIVNKRVRLREGEGGRWVVVVPRD